MGKRKNSRRTGEEQGGRGRRDRIGKIRGSEKKERRG